MQTRAVEAGRGGGASPAGGGTKLGKDDFVKLLMAQLGHQDPLSPMDSSAFVAQLAQFANVELLQGANGHLEGLLVAQAASHQTAAASLVGREVVYRGGSLTLETGGSASAQGHLAADATEVTALVTDASGRTVRTLSLGARPAGELTLTWDGLDDGGLPAPPGTYGVRLLAADVDGESVAASLRARGRVDGVSFEDGGAPQLLVGGRRLALADVIEIHQPPPKEGSTP